MDVGDMRNRVGRLGLLLRNELGRIWMVGYLLLRMLLDIFRRPGEWVGIRERFG
jgi:hypothetical protein